MPELPEVETVRRGLAPSMEGSVITKAEIARKNLRFPFPDRFCERITNKKILSVGRRAKYLTCDLDDGLVLVMHLGMSGSFRIVDNEKTKAPGDFHHKRSEASKHDHVMIRVESKSGPASIIYNDPRRFGFMDLVSRRDINDHPLFRHLGVEPTGNSLTDEIFAEMLNGKAAPIKSALLDQRLVAGIGNIYACEALWRAGISPRRKAGNIVRKNGVRTDRSDRLGDAIRIVIREAIEAGGSTLRDHRQTDGSLGYFQHSFKVYDREGEKCRRMGCGSRIKRIVQSGRSTFYCPSCQR